VSHTKVLNTSHLWSSIRPRVQILDTDVLRRVSVRNRLHNVSNRSSPWAGRRNRPKSRLISLPGHGLPSNVSSRDPRGVSSGVLCTRTVQSGFVPPVTFLVQKLLGEMEKCRKETSMQPAVSYEQFLLF
jgi:hypothetical protein